MPDVPKECPRCGCKEIEAQVLAWWTYSEGKPVCQGDPYVELIDDNIAHCSRCGFELHLE
jgi:hypothetical protein